MRQVKNLKVEDLPDDMKRVHEQELQPHIDALTAVMKKHGYVGALIMQLESVHAQTTDDGEPALGAMHGTHWLNTNPIQEFITKFNAALKDDTLNSHDDLVRFLEEANETNAFAASPLLTALAALTSGGVDPMHVVMLAMNDEGFQADLSPEQQRILTDAVRKVRELQSEAKERHVPRFIEHIENGKFVGFKDTTTGDIDYFEGMGPDSGQN